MAHRIRIGIGGWTYEPWRGTFYPPGLARARELAIRHAVVVAGDSRYPQIADLTAPFVYVRIMGTEEAEPVGYSAAALDRWGQRARAWGAGQLPEGGSVSGPAADGTARDVFLYVISGAKQRQSGGGDGIDRSDRALKTKRARQVTLPSPSFWWSQGGSNS